MNKPMTETELNPVARLSKDLRQASITLSDSEARYLVDAYYTMQEDRKRAHNQSRALGEAEEPHSVINWLADQSGSLEKNIALALDVYSESHPTGRWARSIHGIGPIIAAGLLAHIKLDPWRCRNPQAKKSCREDEPCSALCGCEVVETVGKIWRFAGLDPTVKWEKGCKRPWNAALKVLCWKAGESFVKVSGNPDAYYGQVYATRKILETERNAQFAFREQAEQILASKNIGKETDAYAAYSKGMLPPAHIHARAKRYAVKLFLSHFHHVAYLNRFGTTPPKPYPIAIMGHADFIAPPNA